MSTIIGLDDLIHHINVVYPKKFEQPSERDSSEYRQIKTERSGSLSSNKTSALDLEDIRKEQRRLAALLDIRSRDPNFAIPKPKVRQGSKKTCLICNLPEVDRTLFVDRRYGVLPDITIPQATFSDEDDSFDSRGEDEHCEHEYTDGSVLFGKYTSSPFQLPTLETEIIVDDTTKRIQRERFKLPPIFDDDVSPSDPGRLMALTTDKTYMNINPKTSYDTSRGGFSGNRRTSFLSRIQESSTPEHHGMTSTKNQSVPSHRRASRRNTISESDLPTRTLTKEYRGRGKELRRRTSTQSENYDSLEFEPDLAALRYHHRDSSDLFRVPLNTPDTLLSGVYQGHSTTRGSDQGFQERVSTRGSDRRSSRNQSFEFIREGSSVYSRETTQLESPDELWCKIKSDTMCRCAHVDFANLTCSECLKTGGHQRWCVSKLGLCPDCGKIVNNSISVMSGKRVSRSPSFTFQLVERSSKSPTFSRQIDRAKSPKSNLHKAQSSYDDQTQNWGPVPVKFRAPNTELKVRFSGTDHVRAISPLVSDLLEMEDGDHKTGEKKTKSSKSKQENLAAHSYPTYDADIHKHAYELALKDSRVKRHRKEKDFEKTFTNSITKPLFSYFSKLRGSKGSPHTIGLRDPEKEQGETTKVKKGMKHILGKIKVEDYYEKRKK